MVNKFERARIDAHQMLDMLLEGNLVNTIYVTGSNKQALNLGPLRDAIIKAYNIRPQEPPVRTVEVLGRNYRLDDVLKLKEVE